MTESTVRKCSVKEGEVQPCENLGNLIEGRANAKRKGLTLMVLMDFKTMKTTRTAVVIRSGDHEKRGIVVNFCPMCGEHITPHFPETGAVDHD